MVLQIFVISLLVSQALAELYPLDRRDGCASGYTICAPSGATTIQVPRIDDAAMQNLYVDLVDSSLPDGNQAARNAVRSIKASPSLCCISSLTCLTMSSLLIPFCYDRFTTDYFLPDGSYGTVVGGSYATSSGDSANLLSGDYMLKDGTTGNIYANNEAAKPNTATLYLPKQFTAQGVGSAVPASVLGAAVTVTYTTDFPRTTVLPSIIPASTRSVQVVGETEQQATTQTSTLAGSTIISTALAITETTMLAGSIVVSTKPEFTFSTTVADSTAVNIIQATSVLVSTIPPTKIDSTTIPGITIDAITSTVTTTIHAGQITGTSGASSFALDSVALKITEALMVALVIFLML